MSYRRQKSGHDAKIAGLYDLEETIGKGHFAVVKLAKHVFTGERVAVKVIDKTKLDEVSKAHLFQEVRCMKLVQHPNVVRLYEVIDTQTKLYLILELGDGGDMYDLITKQGHGLDIEMARKYFRQVVSAIHYCHKLHVVHRDLKLENVVICKKEGVVKLTDFGFSNKFVPGRKLETSCGSLAYSAPEILLGDSYDAPAVDVWSLGVILYMTVCGELPFQEANDSETLTMILDCKYRMPSHVPKDCQDLIDHLLVREPSDRPSLEWIVCHGWLTAGGTLPHEVPLTPLISREHLSDDQHADILQRMADGTIAPKEEVIRSLERNSYNHISATYYLLAERLLRKQRQTGHRGSISSAGAGADHTSAPASAAGQQKHHSGHPNHPDAKPVLAPLALSPRVQSAVNARSDHGHQSVKSLVSPPDGRPPLPSSAAPHKRSTSPAERGAERGVVPRKCSFIQEEFIEEDEEDMEVEANASSTWPGRPYHQPSFEDSLSDDSDCRGTSPSRVGGSSSHRGAAVTRPLHSVKSSPQLLNQIFEEGESEEEEEDSMASNRLSPPRFSQRTTMASPEVLRKYEHARRKKITSSSHPQRGTGSSYSSSDTSDTDDADTRLRHDKLKSHIRRRDSSDHSSDTDGPSSNRPFSGGSSKSAKTGSNNNQENSRSSRHSHRSHHKSGGGGKHGKQNGCTPQTLLGKRTSTASGTGSGSLVHDNSADVSRKISNISITSNLSNLSLTSISSRGSKYIVDSPTDASSPKHSDSYNNSPCKDVEMMNQENRSRSKIIYVRSKNFSDLVERFSTKGLHDDDFGLSVSNETSGVKHRRRPKDKMKTDINRNGLIARADCTMSDSEILEQSQDQQQNIAKTKCCSVI